MGYRTTIAGNVKLAFNLLKDLATDVTLVQKSSTGFDFSTGLPITGTTTTKVIKGVLTKKKRASGDKELSKTITEVFLFKAEDIDDPTVYDTIQAVTGGGIWRIIPPCDNDGYIITVNVAKEA
jgi:hypothetical protein